MKFKLMPRIILLLALFLVDQVAFSQIPTGFNYQAVLRNSTGQPLASQSVSVRITLTDDTGTPNYYSEIHTTSTNLQGILTLTVGKGTPEGQTTIDSVDLKNGNIWMKVEVDKNDEAGYISLGLTELQSVPYAQYAVNGAWTNEHTIVSTDNVGTDQPIFEVRNSSNQLVFGVYEGGVRVNVEEVAGKGTKGGFAVGGLSSKATTISPEYLRITPDSARIWINEVPTASKGTKGGFAVGGLSNKKGDTDYFNVTPITTPLVINDNAQMLWYPLKEAFLVGRIQVLDPADVGYNSFASGYHSKAKGDYSQAMGYNTVASNLYATAIGESCLASGQYSFAFGSQAQATNTNNIAIGYQAESSGTSNCYAFGMQAKVLSNSSNSYVFGSSAQVLDYSTNCYALGNNSSVSSSTDSYAFGTQASVSGTLNCYAIGNNAKVSYGSNTAWGSYAIGDHAECYGQRAYAMGYYAKAFGNDAIAFGTFTEASEYLAIAIGANGSTGDTTYATGQQSIAFGAGAKSKGQSSIAIGHRSHATPDNSLAIGYEANASGVGAVALGYSSTASGSFSYALGRNAIASGTNSIALGSFSNTNGKYGSTVINDGSGSTLSASADYQFIARASGGVIFYSSQDNITGVSLTSGSGSWSSVSDVHKKANFQEENPDEYLDKLSKINIQSWNYKSQSPSIRHIGITAQDFYTNFQFGESDTTITDIDLSGVNMIAIKGLIERNSKLNQKVTEQNQKIEALEKDYANLKSQLEEIKKLLSNPSRK